MKITAEHYQAIYEAINMTINRHGKDKLISMYENGAFNNSDKCKDLDRRFRWDLLHAAIPSNWICKNLYPYLNDTHIDTALRQIAPQGLARNF